jgi:hypothetical protein
MLLFLTDNIYCINIFLSLLLLIWQLTIVIILFTNVRRQPTPTNRAILLVFFAWMLVRSWEIIRLYVRLYELNNAILILDLARTAILIFSLFVTIYFMSVFYSRNIKRVLKRWLDE